MYEIYATFHSVIFHKLKHRVYTFLARFILDKEEQANKVNPKHTSLPAWSVFTAVARNEMRRHVKNPSA
jgi:hypothetical protein